MIGPKDVVAQLQTCLPQFNNLFHETLSIDSASVSSMVLTLTIPGHGLSAGSKVLITDGIVKNLITGVILTADDTLRFTTQDPHDLTAPMPDRPGRSWPDHNTVDIENLQEYELDHTEAAVPSENMFETIPGYSLPTLNGNEYLLEKRALGLNGALTIDSVTANTIVIDLTQNSDIPPVPDGDMIVSEVITQIRVAMAPNIQRAEEIYTSLNPNKAWCFVVMLDTDVSKSRHNDDDLVNTPEASMRYLDVIESFATLVIQPTSESLAAEDAQSLAYGSIFKDLLSCLYGWNKKGLFGKVGFAGHGQTPYKDSYYGHSYTWQARNQVNYEDGFENKNTVALRIMEWQQTIFDEGKSDGSTELYTS